jgi:subtilisin family serine protease
MPTLGEAFQYAHEKGVLIVTAAGNENGIDDWQDYSDYVLEVSSVELDENLAEYSNFGPGIKLSAPGSNVYSTKIEGIYGIKTGTSQAAPMVSGCAALLLSVDASLSNADLEQILRHGASDLGDEGRDDFFGNGLLDCNQAINLIGTPLPDLGGPDNEEGEGGTSVGEEDKNGTIIGQGQASISLAMKHKKKVSLVSVKNNGDLPVYGVELKINDGTIKFVKGRGWDRDRVNESTVIVEAIKRPINPGSSLIIILVVDNKDSEYEWRAFDQSERLITKGKLTSR